MTRPKPRVCVDCRSEGVTTKRPAPNPGPRCATHHRAKRFDRRNYSHEKHILEKYGLTKAEYNLILGSQNGCCAICNRARGLSKKLSVDHSHLTGVVRGLLCQKCNRDVLGHLRDDIEALYRAAEYLQYPPAVAVIGVRITPDVALTMNGE